MAIECTTCGAVGESFFSTNDFGDLVCDLCGTQSFLQARNETQDMDDLPMNTLHLGGMKQMKKRQRTKESEDAKKRFREQQRLSKRPLHERFSSKQVTLEDCVQVGEKLLVFWVQTLLKSSNGLGFPANFKKIVLETWQEFLHCWEKHATRSLLSCFTRFAYMRERHKKTRPAEALDQPLPSIMDMWYSQNSQQLDDDMVDEQPKEEEHNEATQAPTKQEQEHDQAIKLENTSQTRTRSRQLVKDQEDMKVNVATTNWFGMKEWYKHRELNEFTLVDFLAIILIATRKLNLGILACDVAFWIQNGSLPYHRRAILFEIDISAGLLAKMHPIGLFFDPNIATNRVLGPAKIAQRAHYLELYLDLPLPPLNASLAALRIVRNLGFYTME